MDKIELAELFQKAAAIRENSYDWSRSKIEKEAAEKAGKVWYPDNSYYLKTHNEAVVEACGVQHADMVGLIYPALYSAWNDVLDWAFSWTGAQLQIVHHPDRPIDFGKEVKNVPSTCPYCSTPSNTGSNPQDMLATPEDGSLGICISCGEASIYHGDPLKLCKITQEELDSLPSDTLLEILRYKQAVGRTIRRKADKQDERD